MIWCDLVGVMECSKYYFDENILSSTVRAAEKDMKEELQEKIQQKQVRIYFYHLNRVFFNFI